MNLNLKSEPPRHLAGWGPPRAGLWVTQVPGLSSAAQGDTAVFVVIDHSAHRKRRTLSSTVQILDKGDDTPAQSTKGAARGPKRPPPDQSGAARATPGRGRQEEMTTKKNLEDQETIVKDSLFEFVKTNIPDADLTLIDEIVLSYVVAILEDVSSDPVFDVEGFCEMMTAYFPEFESINHATVCQWMFELEAKLRTLGEPEGGRDISLIELSLPEILPIVKPRTNSSDSETFEPPKRVHKISELSDGSDSSFCDFSEEVDALQDMFPHVCTLEIKHCLAIACGDLERATQILLHRQEHGQSVSNNSSLTLHLSAKTPLIDDNELKNRIIERYSYIDQDALAREHRPVAPKVEPKKLVRYRDNKIVSLKGERYTEVKKGDDVEDVSLKKSKKQQHCP